MKMGFIENCRLLTPNPSTKIPQNTYEQTVCRDIAKCWQELKTAKAQIKIQTTYKLNCSK